MVPKLWHRKMGRGAFQHRRSCKETCSGEAGKAHVGISNDKAGENPAHRKPKVSWSTFVEPGLVGT